MKRGCQEKLWNLIHMIFNRKEKVPNKALHRTHYRSFGELGVMNIQFKCQRGFTLIEVVVSLFILLMLAHYIWANEIVQMENQLLLTFGLQPWVKYLITVPLFCTWLVFKYRKEARNMPSANGNVVRSSIIIFALASLGAVIVYLYLLFSGGYA